MALDMRMREFTDEQKEQYLKERAEAIETAKDNGLPYSDQVITREDIGLPTLAAKKERASLVVQAAGDFINSYGFPNSDTTLAKFFKPTPIDKSLAK